MKTVNRCRCGTPLPTVKANETPYEFCSKECRSATHTPTLWKVCPNDSIIRQLEDNKLDFHIAQTFGEAAGRNAIFIVRAVNCHEELLESLKDAESQLTRFIDTPDEEGNVIASDSVTRVRLNKIRKAIAKAEGK